MIKLCIFCLLTSFLLDCSTTSSTNISKDDKREMSNGIIYFSFDDAKTWFNASQGLPNNVKIGLGGLAVSNQHLVTATKERGVYLYNFNSKVWKNLPTAKIIIEGNIGAIAMTENSIYIGTQNKGVYKTKDKGKSWKAINTGLTDLTIRRFCKLENRIYVCTNDGFYVLNNEETGWEEKFTLPYLQVNGAAVYQGSFYLATNKGIYTQQKDKSWSNIAPHLSMHNISADDNHIYAMTYNELLLSSNDGSTWQNQQKGFLKKLYTFNVLNYNNVDYAGQWDGVYKKNSEAKEWGLASNGLPPEFSVTNLVSINKILVVSTSERKLNEVNGYK